MKRLSIKAKITVWFSIAIILIATVSVGSVLYISSATIQKGVQDNLIETVENNVDEIEFYADYNRLELDDDYDIYLEYKGGYLEIDDDFIRSMNGITNSLYDNDGTILYGENPIYKLADGCPFTDKKVQTVKADTGIRYYIYDHELNVKGIGSLWLRGIASSEYGVSQMNSIIRLSLWILPALVVIAIVGGYLLAKRALKPIKKMSDSAEEIREGHDLTKRIEMGEGNDELFSLADTFNNMLDRLQKSFNAEQQLTNDISHELRTPVSVIMSQCELSLEQERNAEDDEEAFQLIMRQSRKMSSMINDMLSFARLERNSGEIEKQKMSLSEAVEGICEDMALINERGITLHSDISPDIFIDGNNELISRLVVNLISNAYRYGMDNGNIYVSLRSDGVKITLSVKDDGIGIADEDKEKIWNRFYRADSSRSTKGTGLGLNFVREIARLHGGEMSVESTPGEGSEFIFTI